MQNPLRASKSSVRVCLFLLASSLVSSTAGAQPEGSGAEAIRIFVDCGPCDETYLRREVSFVNYVRDRADAQVHVLITREVSGGGGRVWTLGFFGREEFEGMDDELVFFTTQDDTDDSERRALAQTLRLGLVRYVAQTPLGRQLDVSARPGGPLGGPLGGQQGGVAPRFNAQPADDPWNFWVFRTRMRPLVFIDAEEREKTKRFGGSFSAFRNTEVWKMRIGVSGSYRSDTFELTDSTATNIQRNNSFDARFVRSLGEHMGFGFGGSAVSSTFRNQDLTYRVAPAVEYNFFPYSESTRRQFTVAYSAGYNSFRYAETTVFGKLEEERANHSVQTSFVMNQPWGVSDVSLEFSQFLDEPDQNRLVLFGEMDIRVFRGLSLNLEANSSFIGDQIYLPLEDATDVEVLLGRRQLETDFEWRLFVGLSYSFGSIYNNVVNSRFAGSSGGFTRAF